MSKAKYTLSLALLLILNLWGGSAMSTDRLAEIAPLLGNPNVRQALDTIAYAEGTLNRGADGYNIGFGYRPFESFDVHPRMRTGFTQTDGKKEVSTAAGRYQINAPTYDDIAPGLGITDFTPRSQDLMAIELLRRGGALKNILEGDIAGGLRKVGGRWVSLPSADTSKTKQPKRSDAAIQSFLANYKPGGVFLPTSGGGTMQITPSTRSEELDLSLAQSQPRQVQENLAALFSYIASGEAIEEDRKNYMVPAVVREILLRKVRGASWD